LTQARKDVNLSEPYLFHKGLLRGGEGTLLRIFNTLGRRLEKFQPVNQKQVSVFTCGPSVYQRAHIGNFRTFLFEDILVRYLEYSGYRFARGMNFTDVEDKAIKEAEERNVDARTLTQNNIEAFIREMELLRIRIPEYLPRASDAVDNAVDIIEQLLDRGIAYRHKGNVYFDPLKYPGFGELYGLDMDSWPETKRRFHRDTYPGMRWNRGDFILWHAYKGGGEISWNTRIGRGRPSWNIQDPSMIVQHFNETLSVYCGGYDNLFRHHDYSRAILESIRPYPMAKYWLHCYHLLVNGKKMSKSKGNVYYTDTLQERGYSIDEIRFFLIYGHYRKNLNYSDKTMDRTAEKLRDFKRITSAHEAASNGVLDTDEGVYQKVKGLFSSTMDEDLDVRGAFDELHGLLVGPEARQGNPGLSAGILKALREIDEVLQVIF
jgi:cysteinyl-tRNA synthetase